MRLLTSSPLLSPTDLIYLQPTAFLWWPILPPAHFPTLMTPCTSSWLTFSNDFIYLKPTSLPHRPHIPPAHCPPLMTSFTSSPLLPFSNNLLTSSPLLSPTDLSCPYSPLHSSDDTILLSAYLPSHFKPTLTYRPYLLPAQPTSSPLLPPTGFIYLQPTALLWWHHLLLVHLHPLMTLLIPAHFLL